MATQGSLTRIAERVRAGLAGVGVSGKRLGRRAASVAVTDLGRTSDLSVPDAAAAFGVAVMEGRNRSA